MIKECNETIYKKQKPTFSWKSYLIIGGGNRKRLVWSEVAKFPVISVKECETLLDSLKGKVNVSFPSFTLSHINS